MQKFGRREMVRVSNQFTWQSGGLIAFFAAKIFCIMEAPEVPLEQTQEHIHEHAHHSKANWITGVALTTALLAALAAVTSLLAGHHANEAMIEQMQSSDKWAYYQSKGIKAGVLGTKVDLLKALGKPINPKDEEKLVEYKNQQEEISKEAKEKEEASKAHLGNHVIYARGVTFFQVAIAISAISILTKRKWFWFVGIGFGAMGVFYFVQGLLAH